MFKGGSALRRGFVFGMALQLAVGPVCIFIFQTGAAQGFGTAWRGVLGVAAVDALEIALAVAGVGALTGRGGRAEALMRLFGVFILLLFGATYIFGAFGISVLPSFALRFPTGLSGAFVKAALLTLSNPLTLVFWVGVFSARIAREEFSRTARSLFGLGCVLATLVFLSGVAVAGSFVKEMVSPPLIRMLNVAAGLLMFYFAGKSFRRGDGE